MVLSAPAAFIINEIDADQTLTDAAEFVELKGDPNESAAGLVLVFFNGSSATSYSAIDLVGTADADGYYVVGNTGVNEIQETFAGNFLQNGEDAVALYTDAATTFPDGTATTTTNLVDFIIYETNNDTDRDWSGLTGSPTIYDENSLSTKDTASLSRIPDGVGTAFQPVTPTPGEANSAPAGPEVLVNVSDIDYGVFNADNTASPSERTVRITNSGSGTLTVSTFGVQAGSASQYTLSSGPSVALPAAVASGASVEVVVQFSNSDTASDQTFAGAIEYATDAAVDGSGTVPLTAEFVTIQQTASAGDIVINELSYDPNPGFPDPIQDYNGDGVLDSSQDEFLEFFNTTASPINVQGWTITMTSGSPEIVDTLVISSGVSIEANGFLVFFRGGTPTGFPAGVAFAGMPALGNSGEIVRLNDGTTEIDDIAYNNEEGKGATDAGVTADGGSIGRATDGAASFIEFAWDATQGPTPGASNGSTTAVESYAIYR